MTIKPKPALSVGYIGFTYEILDTDTAEGFLRQGLAVVEPTGNAARPYRARLRCNPEGPWLEGETMHVAVSAAAAWGFHHTEDTEERAIVESCARLGEDLVTKLGVDPAMVYELVWNAIVDLSPEATAALPDDCPNLSRIHAEAMENDEDAPGSQLH